MFRAKHGLLPVFKYFVFEQFAWENGSEMH